MYDDNAIGDFTDGVLLCCVRFIKGYGMTSSVQFGSIYQLNGPYAQIAKGFRNGIDQGYPLWPAYASYLKSVTDDPSIVVDDHAAMLSSVYERPVAKNRFVVITNAMTEAQQEAARKSPVELLGDLDAFPSHLRLPKNSGILRGVPQLDAWIESRRELGSQMNVLG